MLRSRLERSLLAGHHGPLLAPEGNDGGGGGTGTQDGAKTADPGGTKGDGASHDGNAGAVTFTAEQQREVDRIAAQARKDGKKAAEDAATATQQAAERQRQIDADVAKGEFESARQKLTGDLTAAQTERDRLSAENDQLRAAMATGLEAGWKALPEPVRKVGEKQHPEADVLGRWQFLHDPDTQALVSSLAEKADTIRGNGHDPKPGGDAKPSGEDAKRSQRVVLRSF